MNQEEEIKKLNDKLETIREVLGTLITWSVVELGEENTTRLLEELNIKSSHYPESTMNDPHFTHTTSFAEATAFELKDGHWHSIEPRPIQKALIRLLSWAKRGLSGAERDLAIQQAKDALKNLY